MSSKYEQKLGEIRKIVNDNQKWVVDAHIARPDHKRPYVEHTVKAFTTELDALVWCFKHVLDAGIPESDDDLEINDVLQRVRDYIYPKKKGKYTDIEKHLRRAVELANSGHFDETVYADYYMADAAFNFKISHQRPVFLLGFPCVGKQHIVTDDPEEVLSKNNPRVTFEYLHLESLLKSDDDRQMILQKMIYI